MGDETLDSLRSALTALGLRKGDVVLLKGDLSEIGMLGRTPKASLALVFEALWDVIGGEQEGTLITSSFTNAFFRWVHSDFIFDDTSPSKGGGSFTKYFLDHPRRVRSKHPTNSFVAIGRYAHELVRGHDENSRPYDPVGKVIHLNGKALSLGAVAQPPDFMTGHYAQQEAGNTRGSILQFLTSIKYRVREEVKLFRIKEVGGCSRGHYKVYARYVSSKKLKTASFGNAYSISMLAKDAFEISYEMQKKDPRSFLCSDPNCFSCRGTWLWNMRDWPLYYTRNFFRLFSKLKANA